MNRPLYFLVSLLDNWQILSCNHGNQSLNTSQPEQTEVEEQIPDNVSLCWLCCFHLVLTCVLVTRTQVDSWHTSPFTPVSIMHLQLTACFLGMTRTPLPTLNPHTSTIRTHWRLHYKRYAVKWVQDHLLTCAVYLWLDNLRRMLKPGVNRLIMCCDAMFKKLEGKKKKTGKGLKVETKAPQETCLHFPSAFA